MMKSTTLIILMFISLNIYAQDVVRELPKEWDGLVEGGRFQDRFLPMNGRELSSKVWGADNVLPRYIDNGVEDDTFSYWGGNIYEQDGLYHLYVCGWMENSVKGHMTWPRSVIFHTVSRNLYGPYENREIIGLGHNPELYRAKNGEYIIASHTGWKPYFYRSKKIGGPWVMEPFVVDERDRWIIEGTSNLSFADRPDGSMLMVCRGGGMWLSRDGVKSYRQITTESVYPKREGRFEDPVLWRDEVQYHLIVNDWLGRIAYYLRSADGVNWVEDAGEAYTPGIAYHEDGTVEDWYKFERIKVFQDEHRRAISANFAVCDTIKREDLGDDIHSSKNIIIPLNKGVLMSVVEPRLEPKMRTISLLIRAEEGFNPKQDLDVASLRFGLSQDVNFGRGCRVRSIEERGDDLIVTFNTKGYTIPDSEFAPKLLGRDTKGGMIYGYARNPNVDFEPAILSCLKPQQRGEDVLVTVENFGLKRSQQSTLKLTINGMSYRTSLPEIESYRSCEVQFKDVTLPMDSIWRLEVESVSNSTVSAVESFNTPKPEKK